MGGDPRREAGRPAAPGRQALAAGHHFINLEGLREACELVGFPYKPYRDAWASEEGNYTYKREDHLDEMAWVDEAYPGSRFLGYDFCCAVKTWLKANGHTRTSRSARCCWSATARMFAPPTSSTRITQGAPNTYQADMPRVYAKVPVMTYESVIKYDMRHIRLDGPSTLVRLSMGEEILTPLGVCTPLMQGMQNWLRAR